jgi:hypothetical protein
MRALSLLAVTIACSDGLASPRPDDRVERALGAARPAVVGVAGGRGPCLLVLGLPGRRTTSQSFARFLALGLSGKLEGPATIAALQDPATGGPIRQGVAVGERKNRWRLDALTRAALARFVERSRGGCRRIAVVGYSSGGWAAPAVAVELADRLAGVEVVGAVAIGAATRVPPGALRARRIGVLFLVAPPPRPEDKGRMVASDSGTRIAAHAAARTLLEGGVSASVRELASARRHPQWHWGVISPCRHFEPPARPRSARDFGSYPDYGRPSDELFAYLAPFLEGRPLPARHAGPEQPCDESAGRR